MHKAVQTRGSGDMASRMTSKKKPLTGLGAGSPALEKAISELLASLKPIRIRTSLRVR